MSNDAKEKHTMMKMADLEKERSGSKWDSRAEEHKDSEDTEMKSKARSKTEDMSASTDPSVSSSWSAASGGGNWEARMTNEGEDSMKRENELD